MTQIYRSLYYFDVLQELNLRSFEFADNFAYPIIFQTDQLLQLIDTVTLSVLYCEYDAEHIDLEVQHMFVDSFDDFNVTGQFINAGDDFDCIQLCMYIPESQVNQVQFSQNQWCLVCHEIAQTLDHEIIHGRQAKNRQYYLEQNKRIKSCKTHEQYFKLNDEVGAYAYTAALDLLRYFTPKQAINYLTNYQSQQALIYLDGQEEERISPTLEIYHLLFSENDKQVWQTLLQKVVQCINTVTTERANETI